MFVMVMEIVIHHVAINKHALNLINAEELKYLQ